MLFRSIEKLEQVAFFGAYHNKDEEGFSAEHGTAAEKKKVGVIHRDGKWDRLSHAGQVLRNLTESMIRNMCGGEVYSSGLAYYTEGRVSDGRFSKNKISAKLRVKEEDGPPIRGKEFLEPRLIFEQVKSRERINIYGKCTCSWSKDRILCPHAAALMISWVRRPGAFDEDAQIEGAGEVEGEKREETIEQAQDDVANDKARAVMLFSKAREQVMRSLKELVSCIQNGSSRNDDFEVLQMTYLKIRLWADHAKEASEMRNEALLLSQAKIHVADYSDAKPSSQFAFQPLIREFSATINSVSFAIICAIESKYPSICATDLYNSATASTFAQVLKSFVEDASSKKHNDLLVGAGNEKRAEMLRKHKGDKNEKKKTKRKTNNVGDAEDEARFITPTDTMAESGSREQTARRSWDNLIEEFASGH